MTIGERIYALRKEKNLSQEELANELNVSRQSISKWETNQSMPDFDKVVLMCAFFGITTDELLTGKKDTVKAAENDNKSKYSRNLAISVGIYIISVVFLIVFAVLLRKAVIGVCVLLTLVAIATGIIIYNSNMYGSKTRETKSVEKDDPQIKLILEIVGLLGIVLYFVISFLTKAWNITWVIFLIIPAVECLIKLLFGFRDKTAVEVREDVTDEQDS